MKKKAIRFSIIFIIILMLLGTIVYGEDLDTTREEAIEMIYKSEDYFMPIILICVNFIEIFLIYFANRKTKAVHKAICIIPMCFIIFSIIVLCRVRVVEIIYDVPIRWIETGEVELDELKQIGTVEKVLSLPISSIIAYIVNILLSLIQIRIIHKLFKKNKIS